MAVALQDALWFDGISTMALRAWSATNPSSTSAAADAEVGSCIRLSRVSGVGASISRPYPTGDGSHTVHVKFKADSLQGARFELFSLRLGSTRCIAVYGTAAGAIQLTGANGVAVATSAPGVLRENKWHRLRLQAPGDDEVLGWGAVGASTIHCDGALVASGVIDAVFNKPSHVLLHGPGSSDGFSVSSRYFHWSALQIREWSASPGFSVDEVLADWKFEQFVPTSDALLSLWTPSGGAANASQVLDEGAAGDLDGNSDVDYASIHYNDNGTVRCSFPDLAAAVTAVHGVAVVVAARKTDGGAAILRLMAERDASVHDHLPHDGRALTTGYQAFDAYFDIDPENGVTAWTPDTVDEATFGFGDTPA